MGTSSRGKAPWHGWSGEWCAANCRGTDWDDFSSCFVCEIAKVGGVERVQLDAPQHSAAFFQRQGFKLTGGGPDRVEMMMKLVVCP